MCKVVFQVENLVFWVKALQRANNLVQAAKEKSQPMEVAIVAQGDGVTYYRKLEKKDRLFHKLREEGVRYLACSNALKSQKILELELDEDVEVVTAGIYELVRLQQEGYAYIYIG